MSKPPEKLKIGELLIAEGLISEKQLEEALEIQGKRGGRIVEICIGEGYFDAPKFLKFLANTRTTASIDLLNYAIPREVIDLIPPTSPPSTRYSPLTRWANCSRWAWRVPWTPPRLLRWKE